MNMSTRVYKSGANAPVSAFRLPEIGGAEPSYQTAETFDFTDNVDFEPFVEVAGDAMYPSADEIVQTAQETAAGIIAQAERDKAMIEQAAREKAEQEVRMTIEAEVADRTMEIREKFVETVRELSLLREEISARVEQDVVQLALEIAKKIVGREVMFDREIALTLVKVSLKKINSRSPLAQIHLHPEDCAYVEARREQIDFRGALEFIEDRSISAGGCLVHTETGEVDARIESQFEEIAHGLLGKI